MPNQWCHAMLLVFLAVSASAAPTVALDSVKIEALTGAKGFWNESEGVFKVSAPRHDLMVSVARARITPPMGLTAWAAFKDAGGHTVVMRDMVLAEDQVSSVMSAALDNGLEVTALHNHFLWDDPKVMFMHIGGNGDETRLASAVGRVFAEVKATNGGRGHIPAADIDPAKSTLDPKKVDALLRSGGDYAGGVYKVTIGRDTRMHGATMGSAMGVNTWAAFAGSDQLAVVDGDFAMLESELQGTLKALRSAGIHIVAIHHHMTGEHPRIVFLHYWGVGPIEHLARALRAALDVAAH